jgi:hypothetical protein
MDDGYVDFILDLYARPCQCMGLREEPLWNALSPTITHAPVRHQFFDT